MSGKAKSKRNEQTQHEIDLGAQGLEDWLIERQASDLSLLCEYISGQVRGKPLLLHALNETLGQWLDEMHGHKQAIKYNSTVGDNQCAICGGLIEMEIGPWLFMLESWQPVCQKCGHKYTPGMQEMLDAWYRTEYQKFRNDEIPF